MRHLRQVGDDRLAFEILAEHDRERGARRLKVARLDQLAERYDLRNWVRHFDADGAAAGNRRDHADRLRAHGEREIVREVGKLPNLHARRGLDLELGDHRTRRAANERAVDAERPERVHELDAHVVECAVVGIGIPSRRLLEQCGRRQLFPGHVDKRGRVDRGGNLRVVVGGRFGARFLLAL
ncbi:MAG TPA: hypothetical protein VLN49_08405 [Gemmatimonadaceae bacterium]|nr:hypothetical protein [Gemmatimonadaceae bacterium]